MRRPALGTAAFAFIGPPMVVIGLVPWLLTRWHVDEPLLGWTPASWVGIALLVLGAPIVADSMVRFARRGRGTPAPWAPTEHFVATGLYRFVRNPMYVGVLSMVVGQGLLFGSVAVLVEAACVAAAFHLFVVLVEEPSLLRRFGAEYEGYRRDVGRWFPRLRGGRGESSLDCR